MARAELVPVHNRHTLLDEECLSSRVAVNTESIQYEFMMQVISSVKNMVDTNKINTTSHCFS
jgi:hypothetical protein